MSSKVCAIVLAYKSSEDVKRAVTSLHQAKCDVRTILVQSGLSDGEMDGLECGADVSVIRSASNRGAAGGRNLGIRMAIEHDPEYFFFLDRDATIQPDSMERLLEVARDRQDAGIVSCLVKTLHNPLQVHSAGGLLDVHTLEETHLRTIPANPVAQVDFAVTTAALVSRQALDRVGLFDERYFAYYEDMDWAFRARRLGLQNYVVTDAIGFHDEERPRFHPLPVYYLTRNRFLFLQEQRLVRGAFDRRALGLFGRLTAGYLNRLAWLTPLSGICLWAHLRGYYDFARKVFGRGPSWLEQESEKFPESRVRAGLMRSELYKWAHNVKGRTNER